MMFKWIFNYFMPKKEMVICTLLSHFFIYLYIQGGNYNKKQTPPPNEPRCSL